MVLFISNTLSGEKEPLKPRKPGEVDIYICGVTPYSDTHLGHARPSVFWDSVRRYLEFRGVRVRVVQNVTDVNEKVLARAQLEGVSERELADRYYSNYEDLMVRLGVQEPDSAPWVSDHIDGIIDAISDLLANDHAYEVEGDVYFDVTSFPDYGRLSGQLPGDLKAGARLAVNDRKRHPADFALWKSSKADEPAWDSPWGRGRPGWHIECSAMSSEYLGFGFDIHAGGVDLIFPHHENERAQSESLSACSGPIARYWVHHGMVRGEDGKMSKSLGNFVTVEDILERFEPEVLRFFLLSAQYAKPLVYSEDRMLQAEKAWQRLGHAVGHMNEIVASGFRSGADTNDEGTGKKIAEITESLMRDFCSAMDDDLNTARATAAIFEAIREVNALTNTAQFSPSRQALLALEDLLDKLEISSRILGIWPGDSMEGIDVFDESHEESLLDLLVKVRDRAREEKAFDLADMIRDGLVERGFVLEDTPTGTRIRRGNDDE